VVKAGFADVEGPLPTKDGGLYFTEQRTSRIHHLDPAGAFSVFRENTNAANGLAFDRQGNVLAAEGEAKRITRTDPRGRVSVVAEHPAAGQEFLRPNDLIADRKDGVYVTDPGPTTNTGKAYVYYIRPDGRVILISDEIARPNGVTLTPDGKVLLVDDTRGNAVFAFDVKADGSAVNKRAFAQLHDIPAGQPSIADGMTLDRQGRVYVTTVAGIQIFSPSGEYLGTIPPTQAQNLAFGGKDKRTLYVTARGVLYRLAMLAQGPDRAGK
jgi:gluconolactonase